MAWTIISSILIFYGILTVVNIPAPFIGLEFGNDTAPRLWYQPPGYVIPIIWFVLFALLGVARSALLPTAQPQAQWWLFALAFLCATYAYYTLGFAKLTHISALWFGLIGNIIVILFAGLVIYQLLPISKLAAYLTVPVIVWTAFATLIVLGELKAEHLI
ncbi:tryptophan-rich sensory protein [Rudanella lutea]|uniref:tryptophan-rich sensory protein n=1 Tax=Rudanella lutea TaxID=451374 RepID=UPI00037C7D8D|nr:tryptophan-rich sensory protein [Rudanella lutea]